MQLVWQARCPAELAQLISRKMPQIVEFIGNRVETFLLTCKTVASEIVEEHAQVASSTIQLVDAVYIPNYQSLRATLKDVKLVQVVHIMDESVIELAKKNCIMSMPF